MTSIFLMKTQKLFKANFEIAPNIYFFQPQIEFCTRKTLSKKKFFHAKIICFCEHNVVLDTLMWDFFIIFA